MSAPTSNTPDLSSPLLSVIVPVFNEERTIDGILFRLKEGPCPDKEVIVVDDGSDDTTSARLQRWAKEPGFVGGSPSFKMPTWNTTRPTCRA
jgi:cellulose synthase/poly-beta-1,6-N-acetylglucosamine synthase-like glycosyltransferase